MSPPPLSNFHANFLYKTKHSSDYYNLKSHFLVSFHHFLALNYFNFKPFSLSKPSFFSLPSVTVLFLTVAEYNKVIHLLLTNVYLNNFFSYFIQLTQSRTCTLERPYILNYRLFLFMYKNVTFSCTF